MQKKTPNGKELCKESAVPPLFPKSIPLLLTLVSPTPPPSSAESQTAAVLSPHNHTREPCGDSRTNTTAPFFVCPHHVFVHINKDVPDGVRLMSFNRVYEILENKEAKTDRLQDTLTADQKGKMSVFIPQTFLCLSIRPAQWKAFEEEHFRWLNFLWSGCKGLGVQGAGGHFI